MADAFQPKNLLETALVDAATNPAARPLFLRELLDSKIYIVPAGASPKLVGGVTTEDTKILLADVERDGRRYVPFYSSEARIAPGTSYLCLDARAFFEMTKGASLVLNPGISYGKEFFPDEVASLLDGSWLKPRERWVAQKEMQVLIGEPKDYPHELVAALAKLYSTLPVVRKAFIAYYSIPERDQNSGLLVAIDLDDSTAMDRVSAETGVVITSMQHGHNFVDVTQYDGRGTTAYFVGKTPFYQRSRFRQFLAKFAV